MEDAIVHLVQTSPSASSAYRDCLRVCHANDHIVLMHDAVYAGQGPSGAAMNLYALRDEVAERGLIERMHASVKLIDYSELVELCAQHRHTQSWF
ncbi:sulfurtransferase complex subunit TusB [Litorivivens sp.]|uniref:sulfurtransferase complex subunit TusB n=1 Tax=Litorivivens sp. TaxID=2020868 RepID=UPI0035639EC4